MQTEDEQDDGFYYKYNEKVLFRTDSKTQMEYLKNGVSGSIIKPNEARRKLDMSDAPGGDELFANGSIVPLTMAGGGVEEIRNVLRAFVLLVPHGFPCRRYNIPIEI